MGVATAVPDFPHPFLFARKVHIARLVLCAQETRFLFRHLGSWVGWLVVVVDTNTNGQAQAKRNAMGCRTYSGLVWAYFGEYCLERIGLGLGYYPPSLILLTGGSSCQENSFFTNVLTCVFFSFQSHFVPSQTQYSAGNENAQFVPQSRAGG